MCMLIRRQEYLIVAGIGAANSFVGGRVKTL